MLFTRIAAIVFGMFLERSARDNQLARIEVELPVGNCDTEKRDSSRLQMNHRQRDSSLSGAICLEETEQPSCLRLCQRTTKPTQIDSRTEMLIRLYSKRRC